MARLLPPSVLADLPPALERYPGGKRWLPALHPDKLPTPGSRGRLYEPCAGMSAVSFHYLREGHRVVIADVNPRIVGVYRNLRERPGHVIELLMGFAMAHAAAGEKAEQVYYYLRDVMNDADPASSLASAAFLYNRRTCFNGLQRENTAGENNVPYGHPSPQEKPRPRAHPPCGGEGAPTSGGAPW